MNRTRGVAEEILGVKESFINSETALLPALHIAQKRMGCLNEKALALVAETLSLPKARVKGVASFYSMLHLKPTGRHIIRLCNNVVCMIMGAERLVDMLGLRYGLQPDGTTQDDRFTLVIMECIGACGTAPAMLVDNDFYPNLTEEIIVNILEGYK
ncbi:MAG: NAD(P)H-dependent oxidoreductase subunit E [Dissulfurispiraceae bacterium]